MASARSTSLTHYVRSSFESDLDAFVAAWRDRGHQLPPGGATFVISALPHEIAAVIHSAGIKDPLRFRIGLFVEALVNAALHEYGGRQVKADRATRRPIQIEGATDRGFAYPQSILIGVGPWKPEMLRTLEAGCRELLLAWAKHCEAWSLEEVAGKVFRGLSTDRDLERLDGLEPASARAIRAGVHAACSSFESPPQKRRGRAGS